MKRLSLLLISLLLFVPQLSEAQPKAIDMGLSVKWASYNVGASSPSGYGDFFAWGEISVKSDYSWSTYKWCRGNENSLTKYNASSRHGTVDGKVHLEIIPMTQPVRNGAESGNSIFLPAAGERGGILLRNVGSVGSYWSSSTCAEMPGVAYRFGGASIRPVRE